MERVISISKFNETLICVSIGSVLANYLYQFTTIGDYLTAFDHSISQLSTVFTLKILDIATKDIIK